MVLGRMSSMARKGLVGYHKRPLLNPTSLFIDYHSHRVSLYTSPTLQTSLSHFLETMASPNTAPGMVALAAKISSSVAELQELLSAQGLPSPSFAKDCDAVLDATSELHELLLEPMSLVFKFSAVRLERVPLNLF